MLEAARVTKRFGGVPALRGVDFLLERGQVHALVGANGAGKSTLVKVLSGVYSPDEGLVFHRGRPVRFTGPQDAQQRGISAVYQELSLVGSMSVSANLYLGKEPRNRLGMVSFRRMHADAERLLDSLGIEVDPRRELRSLTLGQQQMVAIARAANTDSRVVIMDEPTSSLEPDEVETLFEVIRRLSERDVSIVYISHRLLELFQICNTVTVLRDGQVVHTGRMCDIGPVELVSSMLGRDAADIRRTGTTAFTHEHTPAAQEVLSARQLGGSSHADNVAIDVHAGEVVGLGGLAGSGRTETVRAPAGLRHPGRGTVEVQGRQVRTGSPSAAIEAGIVLVPEDRTGQGLVPHLSVRDNIVLAALPRLSRFGLVSQSKQDGLVHTLMRRLGIQATGPDQRVSELSGVNQQKVMLARWLALSPKVLLLDEPTRGMDLDAKAQVQALVEELAGQGLGIVLASGDLAELVEGADRVIVLREGAAVAELQGDQVTADAVRAAIAERGT
ncbi:sugar ABC transporter ATP-binding protein [Actinocrispum sp. NPDC049592]|uniref:sugar ABC transporter ATP-binding protein n=1 Tax=Actinocrispum sp. NPDC049592 TaxID=3154835 RepID=UPI003436869C